MGGGSGLSRAGEFAPHGRVVLAYCRQPPVVLSHLRLCRSLRLVVPAITHTGPGRTLVKALKLLMSAAVIGAVALAGQAYAQDKGLIGIAMPTKSSTRWISDGNELK